MACRCWARWRDSSLPPPASHRRSYVGWRAANFRRLRSLFSCWRRPMSCTANQSGPIQIISPCELRTMFVSFELSKRKWLLTLLSPGSDKMSKYTVAGGDWNTLIALLMQAKEKAEVRIRQPVRIIAIHEAGLDGFSVRRMLEKNGVESK